MRPTAHALFSQQNQILLDTLRSHHTGAFHEFISTKYHSTLGTTQLLPTVGGESRDQVLKRIPSGTKIEQILEERHSSLATEGDGAPIQPQN